MAKIAGYQTHPLADVFPMIEGAEFQALVEDIRKNGLREPITIYEGRILDGRNRARACVKAKTKIQTRNWKGKDPVGYVVSLNLARRHLDESQRAMVAAKLATLKRGQKKEDASIEASSQKEAADMLNIGRSAVQRARKVLENADPELVKAVEQGHVAVSAAAKVVDRPKRDQQKLARGAVEGKKPAQIISEFNRKDREKKLKDISKGNKPLVAGERKFGVVYADPSWQYDEGTTTPSRKIENHYPTMPADEIAAMPVEGLCLKDAVLFLWVPNPLLPEGLMVMEAWGFTYKAKWTWLKQYPGKKKGTGYWTINEDESVLIGVRGNPPPPPTKARFRSHFSAPVGKHSEKPEEVRKRIEKMYPKAGRIELFARQQSKGWEVWGNQSKEAAE